MTVDRGTSARVFAALTSGALAAVGASVARRVLETAQPGGEALWRRVNHRGEPISLLSGPALALGLLPGVGLRIKSPLGLTPRHALGHVVAITGSGIFGLIDDLAERPNDAAKGLKGHLGQLRNGRLTTGALKVFGIGASATVAACALTDRCDSRTGYLADLAVNTVLIAGTANLFNLFDLRPGRALKAGVIASTLVITKAPATTGAVLGVSTVLAGADLAERDMLGDCGANALGAAIGCSAIAAQRGTRVLTAIGVVALTMASERVSFSEVIANSRILRRIDGIGRRP